MGHLLAQVRCVLTDASNLLQIKSKEANTPNLFGSAPFMGSSEFLQNLRGKSRPHNGRTFAHTSALSRTRAHTQKVCFLKSDYTCHIMFFCCTHAVLQCYLLGCASPQLFLAGRSMSSRLLSNSTLLEGMQAVDYKGSSENAARKRELELKIEARPCA